jgi:hypothetical protein
VGDGREEDAGSHYLQGVDVKRILLKVSEMETAERNLYAVSGSMCMKEQLAGNFKFVQMYHRL